MFDWIGCGKHSGSYLRAGSWMIVFGLSHVIHYTNQNWHKPTTFVSCLCLVCCAKHNHLRAGSYAVVFGLWHVTHHTKATDTRQGHFQWFVCALFVVPNTTIQELALMWLCLVCDMSHITPKMANTSYCKHSQPFLLLSWWARNDVMVMVYWTMILPSWTLWWAPLVNPSVTPSATLSPILMKIDDTKCISIETVSLSKTAWVPEILNDYCHTLSFSLIYINVDCLALSIQMCLDNNECKVIYFHWSLCCAWC
jgi:hypothetical protein